MRYHTRIRPIRIVSPLIRHQPFISVREKNHRALLQQLAATCATDMRVC